MQEQRRKPTTQDLERGIRMRLLRAAWDVKQEVLLPDGRVAITNVEHGRHKLGSARVVSAYTALIGAPMLTLKTYAEGHQSLRWLVSKAENKPPNGWEARVRAKERELTEQAKAATERKFSGEGEEHESLRRSAVALGLAEERVLQAPLPEGYEMRVIESEIVRRAARAAAELEGVAYEVAAHAALGLLDANSDLTERPELIDYWCKAIRDRIVLSKSGAFLIAPRPKTLDKTR